MKRIRTIIKRRDCVEDFDLAVNKALAAGWSLVRRYIDDGLADASASTVFYPVLVAELEREVPDAE